MSKLVKKEIYVVDKEYFPPLGSRYEWHPPGLTNRPWWHRYKFSLRDRRACCLEVDHLNVGYRGHITFYDTRGVRHYRKTRIYASALTAMKKAEMIGDALIKSENLPAWAEEAIRLGWRPPS